jgi:hypothetical protein
MSARRFAFVVVALAAAILLPMPAQARHQAGTIECRSSDYKYNECRAPFRNAGLVRQLSQTDCVEGSTWGYNDQTGFVWVSGGCAGEFGEASYVDRGVYGGEQDRHRGRRDDADDDSVECASSGHRFQRCDVDWRAARLVRQLSDSSCIENQSWGVDGEGLWVDQGCKGRFAEVRGRERHATSGYDYNAADGGGSTIVCESRGGDRARCGLPRDVREVHIDEQLSQTACRRGENWDYDDREIWVSDGCRARFRVW